VEICGSESKGIRIIVADGFGPGSRCVAGKLLTPLEATEAFVCIWPRTGRGRRHDAGRGWCLKVGGGGDRARRKRVKFLFEKRCCDVMLPSCPDCLGEKLPLVE
jgi:hypothetical protein